MPGLELLDTYLCKYIIDRISVTTIDFKVDIFGTYGHNALSTNTLDIRGSEIIPKKYNFKMECDLSGCTPFCFIKYLS